MSATSSTPLIGDRAAIYVKAQRHLARRDAALRSLITAIGPCSLRYEPDRFATDFHESGGSDSWASAGHGGRHDAAADSRDVRR